MKAKKGVEGREGGKEGKKEGRMEGRYIVQS